MRKVERKRDRKRRNGGRATAAYCPFVFLDERIASFRRFSQYRRPHGSGEQADNDSRASFFLGREKEGYVDYSSFH